MIYIVLCILMNAGLFFCFRVFQKFEVNTFQAIVFNYITCVLTGGVFIGGIKAIPSDTIHQTWFPIALVLGAFFIITFYIMAITTQKFSMTVSSIASKMSLIISMLVSLLILGIQAKEYSWVNYLGMFLALVAIVLSSYKPSQINLTSRSGFVIMLPIIVFLAGGAIDSTLNYVNHKYLTAQYEPIFPIFTFLAAAVIGVIVLLVRRTKIELKAVIWGAVLGILNYFSIYFLIKGLSAFGNDGALFYPMLNVGIIILTAIISVISFGEKLTSLNKLGLLLSVVSLVMISYQEILQNYG